MTFSVGHVVRVNLSDAIGNETMYDRPAIIVQGEGLDIYRTILVVPTTAVEKAGSFPHSHRIIPTNRNGLTTVSFALVHQLRAIDKSRILKILGSLEEPNLNRILSLIRQIIPEKAPPPKV